MLDPPTPFLDTSRTAYLADVREALRTSKEEILETFGPRRCHTRRVWSRVHLGLALRGRYYFLTLTSSPESPPIRTSWLGFCRWLKRNRPGLAHIHVLTDEGHGVAHIVLRIPRNEARLDVVALRSYWEKWHNATQIRIEPVRKVDALSRYVSEQGKKALSSEMAGQVRIISWDYTRDWLPVGFVKAFQQFWRNHASTIDPAALDLTVNQWVRMCHDEGGIISPPVTGQGSPAVPMASPAREALTK